MMMEKQSKGIYMSYHTEQEFDIIEKINALMRPGDGVSEDLSPFTFVKVVRTGNKYQQRNSDVYKDCEGCRKDGVFEFKA